MIQYLIIHIIDYHSSPDTLAGKDANNGYTLYTIYMTTGRPFPEGSTYFSGSLSVVRTQKIWRWPAECTSWTKCTQIDTNTRKSFALPRIGATCSGRMRWAQTATSAQRLFRKPGQERRTWPRSR